MKLEVVSVYDRAVSTFGRPVFVAHVGAAVRSFVDECQNGKDTELARHPDDFELMHIASFDDQAGKFLPCELKLLIAGKSVGRNDAK